MAEAPYRIEVDDPELSQKYGPYTITAAGPDEAKLTAARLALEEESQKMAIEGASQKGRSEERVREVSGYAVIVEPCAAAITRATARALRMAAEWGGALTRETCLEVAGQVEAGHLDDCCPVCEEVRCDDHCPLAEVRKGMVG